MSESDLIDRFADGKDSAAMRTIGEVAKALNIRQHVLRYWEEQFPMLKPLKRSGGRRYYRPEDIALVETIDRLVHREGYTLKGAKKALQAGNADAAAPIIAVPASPLSTDSSAFAFRERLVELRSSLANALHGG
jgi:DNA-binding transcriptional MerR regulator